MNTTIIWAKRIYLYLFSAVGLVLVVIGAVELINLGLKAYIFPQADITHQYPMVVSEAPRGEIINPEEMAAYQEKELSSRRQREAANAIALLVVGIPLFLYHWNMARKES